MDRHQAAQDMLATHAHYAQQGMSLASAALAGATTFVRWAHYPRQDVDDDMHGTRFFYHAHEPEEMLAQEHGHFHIFARTRRKPLARYAHVVGVSIDARGTPLRLFTTNQWVTGEDWASATDLARVIQRFRLQTAGRLAPVARWVNGMMEFYASQLVALLHERDARLHAHARRTQQSPQRARADRSLHIVSEQHLPNHWQHLQKESL